MTTYNIPKQLSGLTETELKTSREKFGFNQADSAPKNSWFELLLDILKEPMLLLLIAVTIIYVIVGNYSEALFMFGAIIAVSGNFFLSR
jgi:Ca2+-transporting ATPase